MFMDIGEIMSRLRKTNPEIVNRAFQIETEMTHTLVEKDKALFNELWKTCPKCNMWTFEMVNEQYDLASEETRGYTVKRQSWYCHNCHYRETVDV